jgi:thioredoxin 1
LPRVTEVVVGRYMSGISDISADSFHETILHADEPVVVEFFSHSCPHCIRFKPVYEELSELLGGEARFFRIDVALNEENRDLAHTRGVRSVPTVEVFYRGRVVGSLTGYHNIKKVSGTVNGFLSKREEYIGPSTPLPEFHPKKVKAEEFRPSFRGYTIRWCKEAKVAEKTKRRITKNLQGMSQIVGKALKYTKEKVLEGVPEEIRLSVAREVYLVIEYCQDAWHLGLETANSYLGEIVGEKAPLICLLEDKEVKPEKI